ncbi:MAG: hypothetical protein ACD_58C00335G0004 [uncultured bacterium]|nr:MAG: hypothetical protein ACD_58C00335G0004 [uncultured bacterium]
MLTKNLKSVVEESKRKNLTKSLTINLLKETLQYYTLNYIYSSNYGKKLLFTGGTCLRICYNLNRLSEDLDFDEVEPINKQQLTDDLLKYFRADWQYKQIEANISGTNEKIYLKFPILDELGLVNNISDMKKLFIKVEIATNPSKKYLTDITPISLYGFNFLVRSYDLPTLMANKINALLNRTWQKGNSKITFKGRDYYDLLWFLQNGVKPNMDRLKDLTGISSKKELTSRLEQNINKINPSYLKEDLINLFEDQKYIQDIINNYPFLINKYLKKM